MSSKDKAISLFKEYLNMLIECECKIDYTDYHQLSAIYSDFESQLKDSVDEDNDEEQIKDLEIIESICFDDISNHFVIIKKDFHTTQGDFQINNFVIEVTQNCNIKCEHCLRGCAQNKNLNIELLKDFINKIGLSYISSLTIGGGESGCNELLTSEVINFFAGASNLSYGNSWIVLNGAKKYGFDFIKSLILFENEADENEFENIANEDKIGATAFSFDSYHTHAMSEQQLKNRDFNFNNLKSYGLNVVKHTEGATYNNPESLIKMGRSVDGRELTLSNTEETEIYFTIDGLLFSSCNLSYEEMEKKEKSRFFICDTKNITCDDDLNEAFENYNLKHNLNEC